MLNNNFPFNLGVMVSNRAGRILPVEQPGSYDGGENERDSGVTQRWWMVIVEALSRHTGSTDLQERLAGSLQGLSDLVRCVRRAYVPSSIRHQSHAPPQHRCDE